MKHFRITGIRMFRPEDRMKYKEAAGRRLGADGKGAENEEENESGNTDTGAAGLCRPRFRRCIEFRVESIS